MLVSVLPMWGQANDAFTYKFLRNNSSMDEITQMTNQCQQFTSEVISSAVTNNAITSQEQSEIERLLNGTFSSLQDLLKKMESIEENDNSNIIKNEIIVFLNGYQTAILNTGHTKIKVASNNFLVVTNKAKGRIDNHLKNIATQVEESGSGDGGDGEENPESPETPSHEPPTQDQKDSHDIWTLISLILGSCGVACAVGAVVYVIKIKEDLNDKINHCSSDLQREIYKIHSRLNSTSVIKPKTTVITPTTDGPNSNFHKGGNNKNKQQNQNKFRENQPQSTDSKNGRKEPTGTSEKTILYAKVKGVNTLKTCPTKSDYSVFELILDKPNSTVAKLTLAPLTPEFTREVIRDKATYLPPTFCEIIQQTGNPTEIKVEKPGKVVCENGTWTLQERMQICL